MNASTAIKIIRKCIAEDRVILTTHFQMRMEQRGLFWADILAVIEKPRSMWSDGMDKSRRERWFVAGETADEKRIEILCAIDAPTPLTVFVTLYWD